MFASHRDACILAKYSNHLVEILDGWYLKNGLHNTVIAYRALNQANYHFAATVQRFVQKHDPVYVMCFDVTGFFDNIRHDILKQRLKRILDVTELPTDWFKVLRTVTHYRRVCRSDIKAHNVFGLRMVSGNNRTPIATLKEIRDAGIPIHKNFTPVGVPQGTPISASLSNLYLMDFDLKVKAQADIDGALYQRYSDDVVIVCNPDQAPMFEKLVTDLLREEGLEIKDLKTERCHLAGEDRKSFQYLGYQLGYMEAKVRPASLSKQWRTTRRAIRKAERQGLLRIISGKADKIFTRKLRSRFTHVGMRNFIAYLARSSTELNSRAIRHQAKRLKKYATDRIADLNS